MSYSLGIDIGTSKVAAVITDLETKQLVDVASSKTTADINGKDGYAEQDVNSIMRTVEVVINQLDASLKLSVERIGVTGQMHGVLLWNSTELSSLITWKDRRASEDGFLLELNSRFGCQSLKDGFGCTSLAWLAQENQLDPWDYAATIHDYLVCQLCGLDKPVADFSNAASWGLFDIFKSDWNWSIIESLEIPAPLLPDINPIGAVAGSLSATFAKAYGLKQGIPVVTAIGDNQASILATASAEKEEIYLTLGTGAQLSLILSEDQVKSITWPETVDLRPYCNNQFLAVAAPLCGGQAFAWLVDMIQAWFTDLGLPKIDGPELYDKVDELALKFMDTTVCFQPNFLGERYDPKLRGSITNLNFDNCSLGEIAAALAKGIVENMAAMMPLEAFVGRHVVIGSGNGVRRIQIIQKMIEKTFQLPLKLVDNREEAAYGASLL